MQTEIENIHKEIKFSSNEVLSVFALLACERLFSNYSFFSEEFNFGDSKILREGINNIRDIIFYKKRITEKQLEESIKEIDSITPTPEDFNTIIASSALDACCVVMETLSFLFDKSLKRITDISILCIDTADMYIQDKHDLKYDDKEFRRKINLDPMMIRELNTQKNILAILKTKTEIDENKFNELMAVQCNGGKSNIDLI